MKILMLSDIPEETGSWIGRFYPIAKCLSKRGHTVDVFMPHPNYGLETVSKKYLDDVTVKFLGPNFFRREGGSRNHYSTIRLICIGISNFLRSVRYSFGRSYDVVYVCKPLPVSSLAGFIISLFCGSKLVVDCDDYEAHTNFASSVVQSLVIRLFENFFPLICRLVITNTTFTLERLVRFGVPRKSILYLPNGVADWRLLPKSRPNMERNSANILYFGDLNLDTGHSVDVLLYAFKFVLKKCPHATLTILGSGKDSTMLRNLAESLDLPKNQVYWLGRVHPDKVAIHLQRSDVTVDPVRPHFGNLGRCPLKIIEAMYVGVPVATSAIGDREFLLGDTGFYANSGDSLDLAKTIVAILDKDSDELVTHLQIGQTRAKSFVWGSLIDKLETALIQL